MWKPLVCIGLLLLNASALARGGAENVSSACATLEFMAKMVTLNTLLPANDDDVPSLRRMEDELRQLNRLACQPVILTGYTRGNSQFDNGQLASRDLCYQPWHFPNGQVFLAAPGEDFTFLHFDASGRLFTTRERIRRKLVFDDIELLDVPGVLLLITRLYQREDRAKEFAPADINITGAPF